MSGIKEEFISKEEKFFRFKIGKLLASALSGFIAGVIFSAMALTAIYFLWLRTSGF